MRNTSPGPDLESQTVDKSIFAGNNKILIDAPDHGGYREVVDGGHVAEDGEHEDPGGEAGAGVDDAGDESVPVAVVVELVVRAQGWQGPGAHTVCEEYLCGSVYPG